MEVRNTLVVIGSALIGLLLFVFTKINWGLLIVIVGFSWAMLYAWEKKEEGA
jgi:hypothetical protein